ncbi:MAG: hypothetical protein JSS81_17510 [Acidobacteria bacterium]|nr:hypothetical protein [Acidobacteriota bacterium]
MRINTAGSGHTGPVKNGPAEWLAYDASRERQRRMVERAINILRSNVRGSTACNRAFRALPGGRSFDDIFDDNNVWISYCPDNANYGFTNVVGGSEITICELAFRWGYWTVTGTLVHEMGHVNGAGIADHAAEGTLLSCGLAKVHDPNIIGSRDTEPIYIA